MATHALKTKFLVTFDDMTKKELPLPSRLYYFNEQRNSYLIMALENFIKENQIEVKPLYIEEVEEIVEVEPYTIRIGL